MIAGLLELIQIMLARPHPMMDVKGGRSTGQRWDNAVGSCQFWLPVEVSVDSLPAPGGATAASE